MNIEEAISKWNVVQLMKLFDVYREEVTFVLAGDFRSREEKEDNLVITTIMRQERKRACDNNLEYGLKVLNNRIEDIRRIAMGTESLP